jgi:6-phosphofructokinase 1
LCLGAGIAGGADVILIPEIPYDLETVARHILGRQQAGKRFSLIAVAEGIVSREEAKARAAADRLTHELGASTRIVTPSSDHAGEGVHLVQEPVASRVARKVQQLTGVEARVTSLGHVQRGGPPTPFDRLLCTRLGTMAGELLADRHYNVMVGLKGADCVPVPLKKVAGIKRVVPPSHPWIKTARLVETCMGADP